MLIKVFTTLVDGTSDLRYVDFPKLGNNESDEDCYQRFIEGLKRGEWYTDTDGWDLSPVHIIRCRRS